LDRLSLTEYQHIECQWSSENPIYEERKIVELDLHRAQTRQKFANSSRIHEDVDATSSRGTGCAAGALCADRRTAFGGSPFDHSEEPRRKKPYEQAGRSSQF